ncbi:MAG: hypothetical protein U0325_17895 [Polyangiales bacterium]
MAPRNPLHALRDAALAGLAPRPSPTPRPAKPRPGAAPEIPDDVARPAREALPFAMRDDVARLWRRATHAWVPSLGAVIDAGVLRVDVVEGVVRVTLRNAVHVARGMPPRWVPVLVAALTGRELPAVRRALVDGATNFTPEDPCQTP